MRPKCQHSSNSAFLQVRPAGVVAIHSSPGEQEVFLVFLLKIVDRRSTLSLSLSHCHSSLSPPFVSIQLLFARPSRRNLRRVEITLANANKSYHKIPTVPFPRGLGSSSHTITTQTKRLRDKMTPLSVQKCQLWRRPGCVNSPPASMRTRAS